LGSKWVNFTWKLTYYVCNIDEAKLILDIIQSSPEQQEFYFVDVGAGRFQWVDSILRFLKNNPNVPKNKKYHIIGLNVDGKDEINNDGNFIAYKLGHFKTENIIEAFEERGMNLKGKIDLMVSCWTLKHLVDPLGTFLQMFQLTKLNGYMLLEGIPFLSYYDDDTYFNPDNALYLLQDLDQPYLMQTQTTTTGKEFNHIVIQKKYVNDDVAILSYGDDLGRGREDSPYAARIIAGSLKPAFFPDLGVVISLSGRSLYIGDKTLFDTLNEKKLFPNYLSYSGVPIFNSDLNNKIKARYSDYRDRRKEKNDL